MYQKVTDVPESQGVQAWDRYAYVNNSPINHNDPTGHWLESVIDIVSIGYDIYDIAANGLNWSSGLSLAADVGSLILPGVTGGGMAVRALTHADEVADAAKAVNAAVNLSDAAHDSSNVVSAAISLTGNGDALGDAAKWVKPQDGFFDVAVHGNPNSFDVLHNGQWTQIDHRTLATYIQKSDWNGEPIRLLSCQAGASPTGAAQNLANKLGVNVIAPSDTLWIFRNGNMSIGKTPFANTGKWIPFEPGVPK
jgi:hypothetical protein